MKRCGDKVRDSVRVLLAKALIGSRADVSATDVARASEGIECALIEAIPGVEAYKSKARSLAANMQSNHELARKIIFGEVPAADVVQYTPDQLASAEYLAALDRKKSEDLHFTYMAQGTVRPQIENFALIDCRSHHHRHSSSRRRRRSRAASARATKLSSIRSKRAPATRE